MVFLSYIFSEAPDRIEDPIIVHDIPSFLKLPGVSLEFSKYHHDKASAIFIDARDPEDYEKAKKNYLIAIDIKDNYIDAHFYLAKLLIGGLKNDKNGILVEKPEYDLAIKHLKKIIKLKKYFVQAYYLLGVIYRIEKQYDVSLKYLKKALGINDNYAKAHFEIAMLYRNIMDNRN